MAAKYQRIALELEMLLLSSAAPARLPTEAQLCQQYSCSRQTVRSALALLEQRGLIVRRQGSGAYPVGGTMRTNRQIVLILADREEYTSPELLRQCSKAAQEAGFTLTCLETRGNRTREAEHLAHLLAYPPAGILLEPILDTLGCLSRELPEKIRGKGIPLVYLNGKYDDHSPAILQANAEGADVAFAHLVAAGHREIAAILKWDDLRGIERFQGMSKCAGEMGILFGNENCLWYGERERQRLLEGDDALLRRFWSEYRGNATATICFNDEIAFRLQRFARSQRGELRLVSFDNSYLARDAALTSLGTVGSIGEAAVANLICQIEGKPSPTLRLPWKLHLRRSG